MVLSYQQKMHHIGFLSVIRLTPILWSVWNFRAKHVCCGWEVRGRGKLEAREKGRTYGKEHDSWVQFFLMSCVASRCKRKGMMGWESIIHIPSLYPTPPSAFPSESSQALTPELHVTKRRKSGAEPRFACLSLREAKQIETFEFRAEKGLLPEPSKENRRLLLRRLELWWLSGKNFKGNIGVRGPGCMTSFWFGWWWSNSVVFQESQSSAWYWPVWSLLACMQREVITLHLGGRS